MKRIRQSGWITMLVMAAFLCAVAPRAAAQARASIHGQILNLDEKPWAGVTIQVVDEQGQKREGKTDAQGNYVVSQLKAGKYEINVIVPGQAGAYTVVSDLQGDEDKLVNVNFKDVAAKLGGANTDALKKQELEKQQFANMKKAFDDGVLQMDHVHALKASLSKTPAADRGKVKQDISDVAKTAVDDFETARKSASEQDSNMPAILSRLADAYDAAGRSDDAILAYQQAIALRPDAPSYINLGNLQARAGKLDDARASYTKSADLDPASAAKAWRNFGFVLYNANRLSDAVEPLQKALALDPQSAQAWYCLGASLLNNMKTKTVGDTMQVELAPGTVEAYQKALELDPNGPFGQMAKQGLEAIEQMAPGIQTKYGVTKKKKS